MGINVLINTKSNQPELNSISQEYKIIKKKKNSHVRRQPRLTIRICRNPRLGFQSFLSALTQISPLLAIFGWKILVKKYPITLNSTGSLVS